MLLKNWHYRKLQVILAACTAGLVIMLGTPEPYAAEKPPHEIAGFVLGSDLGNYPEVVAVPISCVRR